MKVNKIKNRGRTGAKVLLFLMLAVTLGFANACRSGGDDDNKGNGMKPGDNMTDAEAVQRAKTALMIGYAAGDSTESVTQDVRLPATGANGVSISWASSNAARVSTTGTVSRPSTANTAVTLTATLTKNTARDTRTFALTVIISEDGMDVEMAKDSLMIGYAAGNSRTSVTQDVTLPTAGANGVSISWESSNAASISTTGTVSRPSAANTEVTLTATFTKNDARDTRRFTLTVVPPCTTSEMTAKLKAMPPSLSGCSAASIRGADMPALRSAGVTSAQFLPVWSADADTGFTPAQLKEASVTVAEMKSHGLTIAQVQTGGFNIADLRTGGFADYRVFNEACNTSSTFCITGGFLTMESGRIECTANHPTITLTTTTLSATDTQVVLEGKANASLRWILSGNSADFVRMSDSPGPDNTKMVGNATAEYLRDEGTKVVSTLSIPLADVFSNPTVTAEDFQQRRASIQLCPGS